MNAALLNMTTPVDSTLMHRYLDRLCSPVENARVEAFLLLPEGRALLDSVLEARLAADMEESACAEAPSEKRAYWKMRMEQKVQEGRQVSKIRNLRSWWKAAMWAAVIGGSGWLCVSMLKNVPRDTAVVMAWKQTEEGRRAVIRLTDGSVIHLGAGSRLRYPESFSGDTREVFLDGEAFFEITESPGQPFMVHTRAVRTTVLGTSFRVSAFRGEQTIVAVATGKVRVDHMKDGTAHELAVLTPGRELNWEEEAGAHNIVNVKATDVEAWKGGRLVFDNRTVADIVRELERWYGVDIIISRKGIERQRLTVTLSGAAPLDQTMQLLAAGGGFSYATQGGKVMIH